MNSLAADCGKEKVRESKMPALINALYHNPDWLGWKGPYLDGVFYPDDGWGMPYEFEHSGSVIRLISGGPDRKIGTHDDIIAIAQMR